LPDRSQYIEWGDYKDVINGPSSAMVANGQYIKFVGCKYFDVQIGNNIQQIAFAIPEFCEQILLGVDALIAFQIQLTFETDKVLVRAGNEIIKGLGEPVIYHIKNDALIDALIAFQIQLTFETDKVMVRAGNEIIKGLGEPVIYHIKIRVKLCYTPTSLNCTQ
jgi:hypothetical protein